MDDPDDLAIRFSTEARRTLDERVCQHRRQQAAGVSTRLQHLIQKVAVEQHGATLTHELVEGYRLLTTAAPGRPMAAKPLTGRIRS